MGGDFPFSLIGYLPMENKWYLIHKSPLKYKLREYTATLRNQNNKAVLGLIFCTAVNSLAFSIKLKVTFLSLL